MTEVSGGGAVILVREGAGRVKATSSAVYFQTFDESLIVFKSVLESFDFHVGKDLP